MMNAPSTDITQWLKSLLADDELEHCELVQSLWSDFGQLLRCYSTSRLTTVIIKLIHEPKSFNHPKGWNSTHSQIRKWRSYQIEQYFYQHYAATLNSARVATLITTGQQASMLALVLSDLDAEGFPVRYTTLTVAQCKPVLAWLAAFHAHFVKVKPEGLWPQGSYWHLATRQDEWQAMPEGLLKDNAAALDNVLKQCPYQTFIHGDAKVANFCFSSDGKAVAAVDFQYVGGGIGVQDVAYFIGSALDERDQVTSTQDCLNYYFSQLTYHLTAKLGEEEARDICQHWRSLYCVASADFHRFLQGWSPTHFKINDLLQHDTEQAIKQITQG